MTGEEISMGKTCFYTNGRPIYLIGVNYWSRKTGPLMWRKWSPSDVRAELEQMKDLGMNVCRSFLYWPDFMPVPDRVENEMLDRLGEFISLCEDVDLFTIPSFFVGHMSGEDWDVPWREGKNFYTDPWMLKQESLFVREVVKKVKDSKAIIGWLLSNEITNYAGNSDSPSVNNWIKKMREEIRSLDKRRPISVGDGVFGREVYGKDNGFRLSEQKELIDFIGPHIYLYDDDSLRHSNIFSFIIKMCDYERPIILEEFGCSNCYVSHQHQADYYRIAYHSAFLSGCVGTLSWCYSDFDLPYQRPYSHHVHELFFGVTKANGSVKEAGYEIKRFSKIMENINIEEIEIEKSKALIIVPSFYIVDYPYSHEDKNMMRKVLLQSYTLTKKAHTNAHFLTEPELPQEIESSEIINIPEDTKLLISPNTRKLTAPFWEAIYRYVDQGGIFYCSFSSDMWIHLFEELFGARHLLRYGLADIPEDNIEIEFTDDFFDISKGEKFSYQIKGNTRETAFCPLKTTKAEILAVDKENRPAIILN